MTGILSNQLPGRANPPDADNPLGSFKDRTAPGANDGSYLTQTWANDRNSLLQALFIASGLTPNGIEDTGTASQLFDALVNNRWSSIGNYSVGTIVTASDGNQYYCNQANGRDTTVVDPVTDALDRWRQYPYKKLQNTNGIALLRYDGSAYMYGESVGFDSRTITFPFAFTSAPTITMTSNNFCYASEQSRTATNFVAAPVRGGTESAEGPTNFNATISWQANGEWA